MNKKGFVFLETIIILVLVMGSLTALLSSYSIITSKARIKEYYDRISDKYLLYTLSNLGTTDEFNYINLASGLVMDGNKSCVFNGDELLYSQCLSEKLGVLKFDVEMNDCLLFCQQPTFQTNALGQFCKIYGNYNDIKDTIINSSSVVNEKSELSGNCNAVFNELQLYRLYFVKDVAHALKQAEVTEFFQKDNGVIEYMKTLKKCYDDIYVESGEVKDDAYLKVCPSPVKYLIGVFLRNQDYYYASIEI